MADNLRADHLGASGYAAGHTPALDRLAAGGTRFLHGMAPSSWTRPSVASLLTGRLPSDHGATTQERPLRADLPTLAELLAAAGYRTLGVSGNFVHVSRESGLARGFQVWRQPSAPQAAEAAPALWGRRRALRAAEIDATVLRLLPPASGRPLFLYVHYMDPHAPFDPDRAQRQRIGGAAAGSPAVSTEELTALAAGHRQVDASERRRIVSLYDAEIAGLDQAVDQLLVGLRQRGFRDPFVAFVADHGEEFGEHGSWFHGVQLHGESLGVPIVLYGPGVPAARRPEPADLLDVAVTLLARAGLPAPAGSQGRDLLAPELPPRDLVAELFESPAFAARVRPRTHRLALLRWPWKALVARDGQATFYRLDRDPAERRPLAAPGQALEAALARARAHRLAGIPGGPPPAVPAATREALRSLGYAE